MSKKSRQDLLVRVRYLNPLPAPPFPPKLFDIPTDIRRLGEPSYLSQLATSAPLPMLVDAEMGMPLDLNQFDGIWDGDDSAINPTSGPAEIDPEDAILLTPATTDEVKPAPMEVSWMRSGSLFMRKMVGKKGEPKAVARPDEMDTSAAAQVMAIDATFADLDKDIRHPDPAKRHLRVAQTYDILPDEDSWGTDIHTVRFPERPSAVSAALNTTERATSDQLRNALIRGLGLEDGSQVYEYHLPDDADPEVLGGLKPISEDMERQFEELVSQGEVEQAQQIIPTATFKRKRVYAMLDYKIIPEDARIEELILSMHKDGAKYRTIASKSNARKMRQKREEEVGQVVHWDKVVLGRRAYTAEESEQTETKRRKIVDPSWTAEDVELNMGEALRQDMDE